MITCLCVLSVLVLKWSKHCVVAKLIITLMAVCCCVYSDACWAVDILQRFIFPSNVGRLSLVTQMTFEYF